MADEQQVVEQVAEQPAPVQEVTATPDAAVSTPEAETPETKETPAKVFTQAELDEQIGKRLARERRKWERENAQPAPPVVPAEIPTEPEAVMRLAEQIAASKEQAKQQAEVEAAYREREEDARERYADFEQVAYNPALPITVPMAETIKTSEIGPEIAYYLGTNPQEAARIARLSPFLQAKELGRLEAKLTDAPPARKATSAPPPIAPVTARGGTPTYDTTDPRSIKTMTTSEWIEADRQRQIRKLEAQRSR